MLGSHENLDSTSSLGVEPTETRKVSFQPSLVAATSSQSSCSAYISSAKTSAAATVATTSGYSNVTRRHSLFGTEDRIVLDIGSRYFKLGFSGEPRPRAIVPSVSFSQPCTSYLGFETDSTSDDESTLWDADLERCTNDQLRRAKRGLLLAQLTQLLRNAFIHHLMVDPKQRKVLVVENPMLPNTVKELICKVLFNNLQVPQVSFVPSPLLSVLAVGRITGLVLEVGYLESSLMPVYYGRPMKSYTVTSRRAAKRLNERLRRLLLKWAKFVAAQNSLQDSAKGIKQRTRRIDPAMLTNDRLEQIKAKALFVSSHDSSLDGLRDMLTFLDNFEESTCQPVSTEESLKAFQAIREQYSLASRATPFTFSIDSEFIETHGTSSLIPSVSAPAWSAGNQKRGARGVIVIPGWVRERAAELLFEASDDEDDASLIDMTVETIAKLPIDLRRTMCENVLVSGGTAMLPGLINRFRTQLQEAVEKAEQPGGLLSIDKHVVGSHQGQAQIGSQGKRNEEQGKGKRIGKGLHSSIAVLNDPWPEVSSMKQGKDEKGGGSAPAFGANLLAWMGGSLVGALKTRSLNAISREAYDEATKTAEDEAKVIQEDVEKENERDGTIAEKDKRGTSANRPGMLGANKRGSFVGVVGGLETGAFGGLAAVSRHLVGVGASGSGGGVKSPTLSASESGALSKSPA
ncbi:related to ACT1 - Actin [Melanopsichium pennsylvanicum]|uniref:Related to ACT1 - Actin n=2 Tax=Melanopsichium pennsylvanicum TaxID=63383 RepID=A0AAJ5C4J5_9BASI|nr:conserved hypothetical protein [Melanopsichium pennsylvanicum 4]SNX83717.1 related to ACT1 - Actin [Melanopsichium pennsylvanicum]